MHMGERSGRRIAAAFVAVMALGALAACAGSEDEAKEPAGTEPAAERSGELSVLSYNVAGLPQEISKEQPSENIPKISPLLEPYDLVLTQEDFDWWKPGGLAESTDFVNYHERLRADVTHEFRTEQHPGPEAVGIDIEADRPNMELGDGLGVLSRFPLGEVERVPWAECFGEFDSGASDCLAMKGFLHTTVELVDGVTVDVYDLHGEAGGGPEDQALQAKDFEQLAAYIEANSAGRPIILAGDTNLHTDLEHEDAADGEDIEIWERFLEATGLTDACTATDCGDEGRIDKVAFRSDGGVELRAVAHAFQTDVFVDEDGEDLSDHQALEVVFAWSAT